MLLVASNNRTPKLSWSSSSQDWPFGNKVRNGCYSLWYRIGCTWIFCTMASSCSHSQDGMDWSGSRPWCTHRELNYMIWTSCLFSRIQMKKNSNLKLFRMEIPNLSSLLKYLEVLYFDYSHLGPGSWLQFSQSNNAFTIPDIDCYSSFMIYTFSFNQSTKHFCGELTFFESYCASPPCVSISLSFT